MIEIFVYIYFFVGVSILRKNLPDNPILSIKPRNMQDIPKIVEELCLRREISVAMRFRGFWEILTKDFQEDELEYILDSFKPNISATTYFPQVAPNIFLTLPPKFQFRSDISVVMDFAKYAMIGDTMIISTRIHNSKLRDIVLLGKKRFQTIYEVGIYMSYIPRNYSTKGSLQSLTMGKGYRIRWTVDEIRGFIGGNVQWTSGQ